MLKVFLALAFIVFGAATTCAAVADAPLWAYGHLTPPTLADKYAVPQPTPYVRQLLESEPAEEQRRLRRVEGSSATFSLLDIRDRTNVKDWFPGDHAPMPDVVIHGPARLGNASTGCAYCHLITGKGRPQNAGIAGLPVAYFLRQLEDFKSGARTTSDPRNGTLMTALAQALTTEEMQAAAAYFGAMKNTPWTRVIETDVVPKTRLLGHRFQVIAQAGTEPIAGRIIEVPEDEEQYALANPRSGFIAYVPTGSTKRGEDLVTTGGAAVVDGKIVPGKTFACSVCHGPDLMGLADVPGIAGRSPSYLVRQLHDVQRGTRKGALAPLMQAVVVNLASDDMLAIAAYVTSRVQAEPPQPPTRP